MKKVLSAKADILDFNFDLIELLEEVGPISVEATAAGQDITPFVGPQKISRSAAQNALMWKWFTEIGQHTGQEKEEVADAYKERFLCHIFIRDDPGYAEMAMAIRTVRESDRASYTALRREVIRLTSSTKCSVAQMREYLDSIHRHATTELGVRLTEPELKGLV